MTELTSYERTYKACNKEEVDRIPVGSPCQCGLLENMKSTGAMWPDAHRDASKMAILGAACHEFQGLESVRVPFCITVACEAVGTGIKWPTRPDVQPMAIDFVVKSPEDIDKLKVPDPERDARMPVVLKSLEILNTKYGKTLPIFAEHEGPYTLCSVLRGLEHLALDHMEHPEAVHKIMKFAVEVLKTWVPKQVEHGANAIFQTDGVATGDVLSPKMYTDFVLPYNKQIMSYFKSNLQGVPFVLHVCGKSELLLPQIVDIESQYEPYPIANSSETVIDITTVKKNIGTHKIAVYGEVNVNKELLFGPVEAIEQQVKEHIEKGSDFMGPCCGMGSRTPAAHVRAMVEATLKYGKKK